VEGCGNLLTKAAQKLQTNAKVMIIIIRSNVNDGFIVIFLFSMQK